MITTYKSAGAGLTEVEELEPGCWISAIAPTEAEISKLENELSIDRDFIRSALDEKSPRVSRMMRVRHLSSLTTR